MEINYIILGHKNPDQILRLVHSLNYREISFYIHIDKKVKIAPFQQMLNEFPNVHLLDYSKRKSIIWGDFSIVEATLNAMQQIVADGKNGYCVLLSGQDYPLRNPEFITQTLDQNHEKHYIDIFPMPGIWGSSGTDRIRKYKINKSLKRGHFTLLPSIFDQHFFTKETAGKINYLIKTKKFQEIRRIFQKRKFPSFLLPHGGSQWWAFPTETVTRILEFLKDHPGYCRYHKYTLIPDEIFFHSILAYFFKGDNLKIAPSLTYVNWEKPTGPLPATFEKDNLKELTEASQYKLFARKFDIEQDQEIFVLIEKELILKRF
ncbi:beta-1,6-N-acetylglucosaminyltransferase [Salinimicrobium sp. TH3]|uniref:beta-1,6-N-acetylglucosaminyltransferase n=1 Tax=Salinimicrobium sp. TH3 TaxID=2997342 RepID=UPI0022760793|nr:beta-1,6-N-acetylglucosaminyltransferase [Salinimicrobium sp. TH3]MCY2687852.1 core-2/I-branching enzyme [Salinimicrobium sp. TH3]